MLGPDRAGRLDVLRTSLLFSGMQADDLEALLSVAHERKVHRGALVFQKGDAGSSMMAVLSGKIRIGSTSRDGKQLTLAVIDGGNVFGELALLDGKPRSADATALEDSILLEITRPAFLLLLKNDASLLASLLALLCDRVRGASAALEDLGLLDLQTRLARVLVKLGADYGRRTPNGVRIELRLSQTDLSMLVAASRESVNRQLQAWRKLGILGKEGGLHLIRRSAELAAFADPGLL